MQLELAHEPAQLLPSGAIYLPLHGSLLIADAHFGKASSFRQLGVPVPQGTTQETLHAITHDLRRTQARQIVFLGDFLHAARAHTRALHEALAQALAHWRSLQTELDLILIRGNHDSRAGDPPAEFGMSIVNEPMSLGGFALCHHPQPVQGRYVLAGHWHPCVIMSGKARERLRLPCFWLGDAKLHPVGILPAYGAFTGMHPIERRATDRVFAIAGDYIAAV